MKLISLIVKEIHPFKVIFKVLSYEYNNYEAEALLSDIPIKWSKNINRVLKINQITVGKFIFLDESNLLLKVSLKEIKDFQIKNQILFDKLKDKFIKLLIKSNLYLKKELLDFIIPIFKEEEELTIDLISFFIKGENEEEISNFILKNKVKYPLIQKLINLKPISKIYLKKVILNLIYEGNNLFSEEIKNLFEPILTNNPNLKIKYIKAGQYSIQLTSSNKKIDSIFQLIIKNIKERAKNLSFNIID